MTANNGVELPPHPLAGGLRRQGFTDLCDDPVAVSSGRQHNVQESPDSLICSRDRLVGLRNSGNQGSVTGRSHRKRYRTSGPFSAELLKRTQKMIHHVQ